MQLQHAVRAQGVAVEWVQSPTPVFRAICQARDTKGMISHCYNMLLSSFLEGHPMRVAEQWEADLGPIEGEVWEEALQAVNACSLNVSQKISQLYILLRVHYTPVRLFRMGRASDPLCGRCRAAQGDLIHLLWRCPKLHRYWMEVPATLNSVFQTNVSLDPLCCLLGALEGVIEVEATRVAFARALFQARKLILIHWKSREHPSVRTWVQHVGKTLLMEKYIYQHRGNAGKFLKLWDPWLATPGLSPLELVQARLLGGS